MGTQTPGTREEFLARAREVGEDGNWLVHETPEGFDWTNPHRAMALRVRLDEGNRSYTALEVTKGADAMSGGWSVSRSFAGSLGPEGLRGTSWSETNPRNVVDLIGAELGWRRRIPGTVLFAGVMGAVGAIGALVTVVVLLVAWLAGGFS